MGINVQFVDNQKEIIIRTLAVKDTESDHSSDHLKKLVMDVLQEFNIKIEQIVSIVTDNARNMLSTVEKLSTIEAEDDIDDYSIMDDYSILDDTFDDTASELFKIHHMRCAVHTLQLAIRDGLREVHATSICENVRNAAIAARTPKIHAIIKRRAGKGAILDQATRWGSTYLMIQRLLELKFYLEDMANPNVTMTEIQWKEVEELEVLLRHPYIATKVMQANGLTPGVFFKEWKNIIFRLSKIPSSTIADGIKNAMLCREKHLLDNDILLAGIYVDPMVRSILTEEQINRAKNALFELTVRMKGLRVGNETTAGSFDQSTHELSSTLSDTVESEDDFEKYLNEQEEIKRPRLGPNIVDEGDSISKFKNEFYDALKTVEKIDRAYNLNVKMAIQRYPEIIKDSALTVTALPPTQVSVERLFSALKILKTDLRASTNADLIEAMLFLRINSNK